MGLTFKTIDQAEAEYTEKDQTGGAGFIPVSLYILEIVDRINSDPTNATILNEFLTYNLNIEKRLREQCNKIDI